MSKLTPQTVGIEYELSASGYRLTKIRLALISIFAVYKNPLGIPELIKILEQRKIKTHKVTLYRELDFLVEKQIVHAVNLGDGLQRFEFLDREHHHHAVCVKCRKVEDVEGENDVSDLEKKVIKQNKFTVLRHSLEFFGLCRECQSV